MRGVIFDNFKNIKAWHSISDFTLEDIHPCLSNRIKNCCVLLYVRLCPISYFIKFLTLLVLFRILYNLFTFLVVRVN